jgi:osmotically-inducible protein OsmY
LDPRAARRYIDHVEKARTRRLMALFGTDWRDPGQYALILNRAQMSSAAAQKMIAQAALLEDYQPTAASWQALGDLTLVARVQVALLRSPSTRSLAIDVRANQGEVHLSGIITQSISLEAIRRLVETVPGVSKVTTDFVNIPSRALSRA